MGYKQKEVLAAIYFAGQENYETTILKKANSDKSNIMQYHMNFVINGKIQWPKDISQNTSINSIFLSYLTHYLCHFLFKYIIN